MNYYKINEISNIKIQGRTSLYKESLPLFWTLGGIEASIRGSEAYIEIESVFNVYEIWIALEINGAFIMRCPVSKGITKICLFKNLDPGSIKRIFFYRESQPMIEDPESYLLISEIPVITAVDCYARLRNLAILAEYKMDRSELINESCLFDAGGNPIAGSGENVINIYPETGNEKDGDIYVAAGEMADGWKIISRVSGMALLIQSVKVAIPLMIIIPVIVLVMIIALQIFVSRIVKPLNKLEEAATEVGRGNFDVYTDIHTDDELKITAEAFNTMVKNIMELMEESLEHEKNG